DLAAAEQARAARKGVVPPGHWVAPRRTTDARANLTADIEAGPGIDRGWRGGDRRDRCAGNRRIRSARGSAAKRHASGNNKTPGASPHRPAAPHLSGRTPRNVSNAAP